VTVPNGDVEVTMLCPVCRERSMVEQGLPATFYCEVGPDGWRCPGCGTTWDHDGTGGESPAPALRCAGCGEPYDEQEMPPPTCRVSGGYCTPAR